MNNIVESVDGVELKPGKIEKVIICPTCGGCMSADTCLPDRQDYPRDIVINEKVKLLKELAERFYKIAESIKIDATDKTA